MKSYNLVYLPLIKCKFILIEVTVIFTPIIFAYTLSTIELINNVYF